MFGLRISGGLLIAALAIVFALTLFATQAAHGQSFQVIHTFSIPDGANPVAGVTMDAAGNLYGTTSYGGGGLCNFGDVTGCGVVYRLQHRGTGWTLSPLYQFKGGSDGATPLAGLVLRGGVLFGTTISGGLGGGFAGVVFKLNPPPTACNSVLCPWTETVLHAFTNGSDGSRPVSGDVTFDSSGNMYGTASGGGSGGAGVVWELTPPGNWLTETTLFAFDGTDGQGPDNAVIFDPFHNQTGDLYGTTYIGGSADVGTVFQLTPAGPPWTENVLYNFQAGDDGGAITAGLVFDSSGNLYGASPCCGGILPGGTAFELSPYGSWSTFAVINDFVNLGGINNNCPPTGAPPGPQATLTIDSTGNLYGTTCADGLYNFGNVFKLSPSEGGWSYADLYDFTGGSDGKYPVGQVTFDPTTGNLYGTASGGGLATACVNGPAGGGCGVVWEITP